MERINRAFVTQRLTGTGGGQVIGLARKLNQVIALLNELRTDFNAHTHFNSFNSTWTSQPNNEATMVTTPAVVDLEP